MVETKERESELILPEEKEQEEEISQLIIPSGFSSSERLIEKLQEDAEEEEKQEIIRTEAEQIRARKPERKRLSTPIILDNSKFEQTTIEAEPKIQDISESRLSNAASTFGKSLNSFGSSLSATSGRLRKATTRKTKSALRGAKTGLTSEQTREGLRRAGRTARRTGQITRGTALIGASRLEQRIFDRPKQQKAFFRPLEAQERKRLGLPTGDIFTTADLRSLSLGIAPAPLVRERQAEINRIDDTLLGLRRSIADTDDLQLKLQIIRDEENTLAKIRNQTPQQQTRAAELATERRLLVPRVTEIQNIQNIIKALEERRGEIIRNLTQSNVPTTIRERAFRAALIQSPSFNVKPVGNLIEEQPKRKRGRPTKVQTPNVILSP